MRFRSRVLVAFVLLAFAFASPAGAQAASVPGPVTFHTEPGTLVQLAGHGPLRGNVEVVRGGTGLVVINDLDLEEYVMGIREVPGMWPMEALKAQAVAARTYALWEKMQGRWVDEGYDVCPTVACQVYTGAEAEAEERGRRWTEAVRATEGEVLLFDGMPALTRYHSSSGGRTQPNHVAFPGSPPRPYLMGTEDPDDAVSPLHSWTVDFPPDVTDALLRERHGFAGAIVSVTTDPPGRLLIIETEDAALSVPAPEVRAMVNERAPALFADRYPGPRNDGQRMPLTVPSPNFTVEATGDGGFRIHGGGYGHGVGMSQWGAMGRALRGENHVQILAAYYGGLQPQQWEGDQRIRVGLIPQTSEVRLTGRLTVSHPGGPLEYAAEGEWVVRPGPGPAVVVEGPPRPVVAAVEVAPEPSVADVSVAERQSPVAVAKTAEPARPVPMALAFLVAAAASVMIRSNDLDRLLRRVPRKQRP